MKITKQGILWQNGIRQSIDEFDGCISDLTFSNEDLEVSKYSNTSTELNSIKIGLGLYKWKYDPDIISTAVAMGIRFIDTAPTYGFGKVNAKLSEIKINKSVIISNKIAKNRMTALNIVKAWERSNIQFPNNPVLYQLHWPLITGVLKDIMTGIKSIQSGFFGTPKYIGVCNCDLYLLNKFLSFLNIQSLQIPFNFFRRLDYDDTLNFCKNSNIPIFGYSPFGQDYNKIFANRRLKDELLHFAKHNNCTANQYILSWIISRGVIPIFASNSVDHIKENSESVLLEIKDSDEFNEFLNETV